MTTSPETSFLHEIVNYDQTIPAGKLTYFRARLQDRIYDLIVRAFVQKEADGEMTRGGLANRIRKDPAQITRYLTSPSNWTLDTVSDLLLGICGAELEIGIKPLQQHQKATLYTTDATAGCTTTANTGFISLASGAAETITTAMSTRAASNSIVYVPFVGIAQPPKALAA